MGTLFRLRLNVKMIGMIGRIGFNRWFLSLPPTYLQCEVDLGLDDYRRKQTKKAALTTLPLPSSSLVFDLLLKELPPQSCKPK